MRIASTFLAGAFALVLAGFVADAVAQQERTVIFQSSDLRGRDVRNPQNEDLGEVEDFVISMKTGNIVYVAVSHGEILGFGGRHFALHPKAIGLSADRKVFVVNHARKAFQDAKGFDANNWPTTPDTRWGKDLPANGTATDRDDTLIRVSRATGLPVRNKQGEDLGKVHDFAINLDAAKVPYVAVSYGTTLGAGGRMVAVPPHAMMLRSQKNDADRREFVIDMAKQEFQGLVGFKNDTWPSTADPRFEKK
jgi:sporulation protein YlmC with PRC-barrel domain